MFRLTCCSSSALLWLLHIPFACSRNFLATSELQTGFAYKCGKLCHTLRTSWWVVKTAAGLTDAAEFSWRPKTPARIRDVNGMEIYKEIFQFVVDNKGRIWSCCKNTVFLISNDATKGNTKELFVKKKTYITGSVNDCCAESFPSVYRSDGEKHVWAIRSLLRGKSLRVWIMVQH